MLKLVENIFSFLPHKNLELGYKDVIHTFDTNRTIHTNFEIRIFQLINLSYLISIGSSFTLSKKFIIVTKCLKGA